MVAGRSALVWALGDRGSSTTRRRSWRYGTSATGTSSAPSWRARVAQLATLFSRETGCGAH
eukprot:8523932-Pyramimonas_sp.AAC.1